MNGYGCVITLKLSKIHNYMLLIMKKLFCVLLWKHNIQVGLPYLYVNGNLETIKNINNNESIEEKIGLD
jgi:hypothetical protein